MVEVRPAQATLLETAVVLTLRFTNETSEPIQVRGSSHRLFWNGSVIGRGVSNDIALVPPLGTVTQPVTIHLENLALVRQATELAQAPNAIDYRLESELFAVGTPRGRGLRSTSTGHLDLRSLIGATNGPTPSNGRGNATSP